MRFALALALTLAGCTGSVASPDREGGRLTVVSLNPCTDAMLVEIADPDQVLALSHYSSDPAASSMDVDFARKFAMTGGTVEEILALDPDVVLAGTFLPPATRSALEHLGMRVETFGIASSLSDSTAQVARMGELLGRRKRSEQLVARIEAAVATGRSASKISTVLWQPGGIVPGEATLVGELMRNAGFASHSAQLGMGQADYLPLELLLTDPPEVLLVAGDSRAQHHEALQAIRDMRQARFDPSLLYCGGPTIIRAAERLGEIRQSISPLPLAGGVGGGQVNAIAHPAATRPLARPSLAVPPAGGRELS